MKNSKVIILLTLLLFLFVFSVPASAMQDEIDIISSNNVKGSFIPPLEDAKQKNESEIDKQLSLMGFTDQEIAFTSKELKIEIAGAGGKKNNVAKLNPQPIVINSNGEVVDLITTNDVKEGNFTMFGYAISKGSVNASEKAYDLYVQYKWAKPPLNAYTDTLAMAWESGVVPYGDPYSIHNWRADPQLFQYTNNVQTKDIYGDAVEIDVISTGPNQQQDGFLKQTVRVSKDKKGTGVVALKYAHKLAPGIAVAVLNYLSIDISGFAQQEWPDRFNFTY